MVDKKISDLTAAASLAATDVLEIDTGAASQKVTGAQIRTLALSSTGITANRALRTDASGNIVNSTVTATELGRLVGVTSDIQTQLDAKAATSHTHLLTAITDVTATVTEVNRLSGVTSNVQTQIDGKLSTAATNLVPSGGTTGQVLKKNSNTNYDLVWGTDNTGGGGGGISDAVDANNYVRTSGAWVDITSLTFTPAAHTQTLSTISDVTASAAEVNVLDGSTATTADFNEIAGISAFTEGLRVYLTPVTSSTTGAITVGTTHQNAFVYCTNTSTATFTIPPNSTTAFAVGTEVEFWRSDASVVITEGSGVTLNGHDGTAAVTTTATIGTQHTGCCIKKVATDTWVVFGRFTSS